MIRPQQDLVRYDIGVDLSKRTFLKVGGIAAVGTLALGAKGCGPSMSTWAQTIIGAMEELKPLLPAQVALLTKAISVAKSFNEAWQAEKFASAIDILENLTAVIDEIMTGAGVNVSQQVKTMLTVAGVALRTIAVIMREQISDPQVAAAVAKSAPSPSGARQRSLIERLSDPAVIDRAYEAAKP